MRKRSNTQIVRFDVDAMRWQVGDKDYVRGEACFRERRVRIIEFDTAGVSAHVEGTETYTIKLTSGSRTLKGRCSCPRFADVGFCKHMIATALETNAVIDDADNFGQPTDTGAVPRIRAHLKARGVDELVELVIDLARRDAALLDRLEIAATTALADDKTIEKRLRKAIDKATRDDLHDSYDSEEHWADGVAAVLDPIEDLAATRPALALRLIDHALGRIADNLGSIDTSMGYGHGLLERAREMHLATVRLAKPDPAALARDLFEREIEDEWDTFDDCVTLYADVLGPKGLAAHRALAAEAWAKLPPLSPTKKIDYDREGYYSKLHGMLDAAAEREGDTETRIALFTKTLTAPSRYAELVAFCVKLGRETEALRWAEEGLFMFEDGKQNAGLATSAVALLTRAGRRNDAVDLLRRTFAKAPSLDLYKRIREVGGAEAALAARRVLADGLDKDVGPSWQGPGQLLISILSLEKMYGEAWDVARRVGAARWTLMELAKTSEATHPAEALEVYRVEVESLVSTSGYNGAVALVERMAKLESAADHAAYIAALKERHHRKRNLMKLL